MGSIQFLCFHCNGYITTEIYYQSSQIYVLVWSELNQCYLPSNSNIFQHLFFTTPINDALPMNIQLIF